MSSVTVVQSNFNGGELTPLMGARKDQVRYINGCSSLENMVVLSHGPAARRPGFQFLGKCRENATNVRLIPFTFNADQNYVLEFGHKYIRFWKDGGQVLNDVGAPVEIPSPWTSEMLPSLSICQSADVLFVASSYCKPHKLCRLGHGVWDIEIMKFGSRMKAPNSVKATPSVSGPRKYSYVVAVVDPLTREESEVSQRVTASAPEELSDASNITVEWDSLEEDAMYAIYKCWDESGTYGYAGQAKKRIWTDKGVIPDFSEGSAIVRNVFERDDEYPAVVQFYQQRLCLAASNKQPQTVWMSRSGSYSNFNISDPLRDDDSISATIAADKVNRIEWMVPCKQLLLGTAGSEWSLSGGDQHAVSPASVSFERQSSIGTAPVPPLLIGDSILFLQRGGRVIREFQYSLQKDGYVGTELSILSEHLLRESPVVSWAYQQEPYSIVWCVLADGTLAAFTYEREHDVVGWHRHSTDGRIESICTITGAEGDELWCVVSRTVKGEKQQYVERLAPFQFGGKAGQFFVDSGISYSGEPKQVFSGLEHLEGRTVQVLADGYVMPPLVVENGAITLPQPASTVCAGLMYTSELVPTEKEIMLQSGSSIGKTRRINRITIQVHETPSLKVRVGEASPFFVDVNEEEWRNASGLSWTNETVVEVNSGYESPSDVVFKQDAPLPLTLLSYTMQMEVGSR